MNALHHTRALAIVLITSTGGLFAATPSTHERCASPTVGATAPTPPAPKTLAARTAPSGVPIPLSAAERAELAAAQQHSPALAELRAGFEPTHNEWTWLAIGAGIVLLVVLL